MKLYKTAKRILLFYEEDIYSFKSDWDKFINRSNLFEHLLQLLKDAKRISDVKSAELIRDHLLPPIGRQEVWAAGVTYLRSRDARIDEAKESGGGDFYAKVYEADRPELFFKALPQRVSGDGEEVHIRRDSSWNVPEPELTLYINSEGSIQGYTIGNDMSSRSIEGENPLYLPQAKVYEKSAALGPCLYVPEGPISPETNISIRIVRNGKVVFEESASINRMKRTLKELADYLYRECEFPHGCYLMTGTCMVPPDDFTLQPGDEVKISIDNIGSLSNIVAVRPE